MLFMKYNQLVLITASAISLIGCSSKAPELPKPEGDKIALNQMGIPAELAIEINRQSYKSNVEKLPSPSIIKTPVTTPVFLHAKNESVKSKDNTVPLSKPPSNISSSSPKNPFSGGAVVLNTKAEMPKPALTDSIVSNKIAAPIITTTSVKEGASPSIIKPVTTKGYKNIINPVPIKLEPVGKNWAANTGETLKGVLNRWASSEICKSGEKWQVVWPVLIDYRIDSPLVFTGTYFEAVSGMFDLYRKANAPLFVDIYKAQCIISVSDKVTIK